MTRFLTLSIDGSQAIAIERTDGACRGYTSGDERYPGDLLTLLRLGESALANAASVLAAAPEIDLASATLLPPLQQPGKIICIGLNYADHSLESGFEPPAYPTVFARWANSLVGSGQSIIRPLISEQLDFEGEIAAIIGKRCSRVKASEALDYIAGYSVFNDGSIRDYQFKSPQWTMGKSFDGTGGFGPAFVTADCLPPAIAGLKLETRLNGGVVQSASTDDMIFDVPTLIELLSAAITLEPGDVIVTGTPAGVGMARKPPLWMKAGDVCTVEAEGIGVLVNSIADEPEA